MKDSILDIADKIFLGPVHVMLENVLYTFLLFFESMWLGVTWRSKAIDTEEIHRYFRRLVLSIVTVTVVLLSGMYLPLWSYLICGIFTVIWEDVLDDVFLLMEGYLNHKHEIIVDVVQLMEVPETMIVTAILTAIIVGYAHTCGV
jgi:hypothetical protein